MKYVALLFVLAACSSGPGKSEPPASQSPSQADLAFTAKVDAFYAAHLERNPEWASSLGYHEFDGQLGDVSDEALKGDLAVAKQALADLEPMSGLSKEREYERQIVLYNLRGIVFDLEVLRWPWRNPMSYAGALGFAGYISRDYAPASQRAKAMVKACEQAPTFYADAERNLEEALPKPTLETALLISRGTISFLEKDVPTAMAELPEAELAALKGALGTCIASLEGYIKFLESRVPSATDAFAIGEAAFLRMLADSEGLSIDLKTLEAIGQADLERNLGLLAKAAEKLAPGKSVAEAVAMTAADKPAIGAVLQEATTQSEAMKSFLIEKEIVSIPGTNVAQTRETPAFLRWNFAFLSTPGAFETKALPSFYYISPPDPSWPQDKQRSYVASKSDLLFVTIHEVWPGHFLHYLHAQTSKSKIARSFCTYSMSEGWAHYTEEMMWDAGVGNGDPKVRIGQLQNALLRNVRFISAIGLHTKGMTVDESRQLFLTKGHQDEGNAEQQAKRGTFDPGYLNYTLGKLMIRKLHDDWKASKGQSYTLKRFHDEFLSYQCAPIPVIRKLMLGDDAGAAL